MSETPAFERLLKRDRVVTIAGVAILCALAWLYIVSGAGFGMSALDMTSATLFPHHAAQEPTPDMPIDMSMGDMDMGGMPMDDMAMPEATPPAPGWSLSTWALTAAMWWVMMIAMMSPSAMPTILLYARAYRHAAAQGQLPATAAPTGAFTAGYLMVWLAFSIAAASLQGLFVREGLVSEIIMGSQSRWLSAAVLIAAGVYQLTPLKNVCLDQCRSPTNFLTRYWRPGAAGALRLGVIHGAFCVGCCWVLMALLFVGGVMNLVWIAALTILVLAEKLAPGGVWLGRGVGVALLAWGVATLFV